MGNNGDGWSAFKLPVSPSIEQNIFANGGAIMKVKTSGWVEVITAFPPGVYNIDAIILL